MVESTRFRRIGFRLAAIAGIVLGSGGVLRAQGSTSHDRPHQRARVAVTQALPAMEGAHLKVTLVEVNYGPGEASPPHSHPCPVVGYVAEGAVRSQVRGGEARVYQAGDTFYEEPNGVHVVSENASRTAPAKLLAYFVCDREGALSVDAPATKEGVSQ